MTTMTTTAAAAAERLTLADDAQGICDEVMTRYVLPETRYDHARVDGLVTSISEQILQRLTQQAALPRKYVVHVTIMQNNGAGLCAASSCEWRATSDACYVHRANNKAMCLCRRMRICYVTDIEGDVHYLERFLDVSKALRRCPPPPPATTSCASSSSSSCSSNSNSAALVAAAASASSSSLAALPFVLDFVDDTTHFVYGGDVFDHGSDLTFARLLLNFHHRYPQRVHLMIGNRDVNKMVMRRLLRDVDGDDVHAVQRRAFPRSWSGGSSGEAMPYANYLQAQRDAKKNNSSSMGHVTATTTTTAAAATVTPLRADCVSLLQWALEYKLGSKDSFAHRRRELQQLLSSSSSSSSSLVLSDSDVADSFFAAAQDGGVYEAYLRAGKLMIVLDGVLFVHGGVTADNLCFVPDAAATYTEDDVCVRGSDVAASLFRRGVRLPPQHTTVQQWADALDAFRATCVDAWAAQRDGCGEALRRYACPRECTPHSVVVASPLTAQGPHYTPLSVAAFLLASGVHTVCAGHQPVGDTPLLISQPGGLLTMVADNSYCGAVTRRSEAASVTSDGSSSNSVDDGKKTKSSSSNNTTTTRSASRTLGDMRGRAVTEIIFEGDACDTTTPQHDGVVVRVHGRRVNGQPYMFDARDTLLGRHVGDGWWTRCLTRTPANDDNNNNNNNNNSNDMMSCTYELQRTRDSFRSVDVRTVDGDTLHAMLRAHHEPPVDGDVAPRYTREQLAEVRVHRLKTKVTSTAARQQQQQQQQCQTDAATTASSSSVAATQGDAVVVDAAQSPHKHHL